MAMTSVSLRAEGGSEDSLDMRMVSRTEYVIREHPRAAADRGPDGKRDQRARTRKHGSSHAGVFGADVAQTAAVASRTLGDDPALERPAVCALADCDCKDAGAAAGLAGSRHDPGVGVAGSGAVLAGPHQNPRRAGDTGAAELS